MPFATQPVMHRWCAAILAVLLSVFASGCSDEAYSQDSPEATIATARMMVERGEARKLGNLIYAENEDERKLYLRFGLFLGNLEKLGSAIGKKFPDEVAELKAKAEEAAAGGKGNALVAQLSSAVRPQGNRRNRNRNQPPADPKAQQEAFADAIKVIFADPYGWLRESESRMTAVYVSDNTAALLWDEKPILPPIGMVMKRDDRDGRWYFVLPTNAPGISGFMPKRPQEFQLWGSLITVFDNTVKDLTKDVESGSIRSLEGVSRAAGEKAFIPVAISFFALSQYQEAKRKEAAAAKAAPAPAAVGSP